MSYKDKNKQKEYQKEYEKTHKAEHKERNQKFKERHPEYYNIYNKTHKERNQKFKERHPEYFKIYNKTHPRNRKEYHLQYTYGLSIAEFNNILLAQNMKCAICKEPLDLQNPHNVVIDHNHLTGKIRGILCKKCNFAIGLLRDNPEYAYSAFIYLKKGD